MEAAEMGPSSPGFLLYLSPHANESEMLCLLWLLWQTRTSSTFMRAIVRFAALVCYGCYDTAALFTTLKKSMSESYRSSIALELIPAMPTQSKIPGGTAGGHRDKTAILKSRGYFEPGGEMLPHWIL